MRIVEFVPTGLLFTPDLKESVREGKSPICYESRVGQTLSHFTITTLTAEPHTVYYAQ